MSGEADKAFCRWKLSNVLIAGKRHEGEAWGRDQAEAVRRFAARIAAERKCNIAAAIACAKGDSLKRVEPLTRQKASS